MNPFKKIPDYILSIILKGFFFVLKILGKKLALNISSQLISTIAKFTKYNSIALKNLQYVWPHISKTKRDKIICSMWKILGINIAEFIFLRDYNPLNCKKTKIEGLSKIHKLIKESKKKNKGIIFFSAHFGSWEKIPIVLKKLNLETLCIYRKSNNIFVDKIIQDIRNDLGNYTPKGDQGAKKSFLWLRKGKSLALLMDQKLNEGVKINFLDKPAFTATAIAELALRMKLDIVPIKVSRKNIDLTEITFFDKLSLPTGKNITHKQKVSIVLNKVNSKISEWILKEPEQWLWTHRRWPKDIYEDKKS